MLRLIAERYPNASRERIIWIYERLVYRGYFKQTGLFEAANVGTIFLDEISVTTVALQIKLLRVLQDREFMRVGGTTTLK